MRKSLKSLIDSNNIEKHDHHVRNNGNNILSATNIKRAIDLNQNINSGVRTYVCQTNSSLDLKDMFKFLNVTSYHSFEYSSSTDVTYFRHYNIGKGETKNIESFFEKSYDLKLVEQSLKNVQLDIIVDDLLNKGGSPENKKILDIKTFNCSTEGCNQIFFEQTVLEKHLDEHNLIKNIQKRLKTN